MSPRCENVSSHRDTASSASKVLMHVAHRLRQIHRLRLQVDAAGREPRDVEQAVERFEQAVQALFDPPQLRLDPVDRDRFAAGGHLLGLLERQPQLEGQGRDRIPQLVGDRGDEFVARRDRLLQLLQPQPHRGASRGVVGSLDSLSGSGASASGRRRRPSAGATAAADRGREPETGIRASTVVPPPGVGSISRVPPTAAARSRIPASPIMVSADATG